MAGLDSSTISGIISNGKGALESAVKQGILNNASNALLDSVFGHDINRYFRDGRLSASNFNLYNPYLENNLPRLKFQYFVKINFNNSKQTKDFLSQYFTDVDTPMLIPLVKTIEMPSIEITTNEVNQYNKKRISQSRINFKDIQMTMHDVVDGKALRFWEAYYEYYFRDGLNADGSLDQHSQIVSNGKWEGNITSNLNDEQFVNDVVLNTFNNNFGYNIEYVKNEKYLIDSIEVYQIHAGSFSKVCLVHPRITTFSHDTLSYEQSQLVEMKFIIAYEDAVYHNFFTPLDPEGKEVFSKKKSDYRESVGQPVNTGVTVPHRVAANTAASASKDGNNGFLGNLEKSVGGVLSTLPNIIGNEISSAIFTGHVNFGSDVKQFGYTLGTAVVTGASKTQVSFSAKAPADTKSYNPNK